MSIESCSNLLTIIYQNEYLAVYDGSDRIAATPDIITILDKDTGRPIASESLSYGIHVSKFPAHTLCTTPEGPAIVGPEAFGLSEKKGGDMDYRIGIDIGGTNIDAVLV